MYVYGKAVIALEVGALERSLWQPDLVVLYSALVVKYLLKALNEGFQMMYQQKKP